VVPDKAGVAAPVDDGFAAAGPDEAAPELGPPDEAAPAPAPAQGTQVSTGSHSSELEAEVEPDAPLGLGPEDPWALEFPDSCAPADVWPEPVGAALPAAAPPLQLTDGATSGGYVPSPWESACIIGWNE
jgi:hypothetical protein